MRERSAVGRELVRPYEQASVLGIQNIIQKVVHVKLSEENVQLPE